MLDLLSQLGFGVDWVITVLLLSIRLGATLLFTPLLTMVNIPGPLRVIFLIGLAAVLASSVPHATVGASIASRSAIRVSDLVIFEKALSELAFGLTLAVGIHLAFAVFSLVGRLLDIQIGFGLAQVFDPSTNAVLPILTTIFNQAAVMVFFLIDGHHAVLRGVFYSLQRFPLGAPWDVDAAAMPILRQAGAMLGVAFSLAAPIAFCILISEFALALLSRSVPQMHMLSMGLPVKILLGLMLLSFWIAGSLAPVLRVYDGIYRNWDEWFLTATVKENH